VSRRHKAEEPSLAEGELNLVPYLDIIVNLNMFMLLTFQVVLEMKVINFNPPASGSSTDIVGKKENEDKILVLTVLVKETGHAITTDADSGAREVPKIACVVPKPPAVNDVCFGGRSYDFLTLQKELEALKKRTDIHVDPENLIVVAEPHITYDHVVATLDAARYMVNGTEELFPHVTLGLAVGSQ
jgi:biopolymer transport protein TolR